MEVRLIERRDGGFEFDQIRESVERLGWKQCLTTQCRNSVLEKRKLQRTRDVCR